MKLPSPSSLSQHLPAPIRAARRLGTRHALRSAAVPAAAHLVPSVLVLGQWWPDKAPALRALPGGLCRWRGPATGRPEVALTFDDGPDPEMTPKFLDLLDEREMRGTFFCLGERAEANPDLVREIHDRGHEVGIHGYEHGHHLLRTGAHTLRDLEKGIAVLDALGPGLHPRHFRPPYGQVSGGSIVAAHKTGLDMVLWSAWGREWADRSPESVAQRVAHRLEPGVIVLLHDADATAPPGTAAVALEALSRIIDELDSRQMKSVRIVDLIRR